MKKPLLSSVALSLVAAAWSTDASASGYATARFGGEHGNVVTTNPTAMYYNPAGLALQEGTLHVFVDGNVAFRAATYSHAPYTTDEANPVGANSGEASLFNVVAAPMLGASLKVGDLALGLGAYVPFGGSAVWDKNETFRDDPRYPGAVDGVQRWYSIEGTLQSIYITAAAAYEITDMLSLGVSFNLIRSRINTIRARETTGTNSLENEGRSMVDVADFNASLGAGFMLTAIPKTLWIGASYQAPPGFGEMKLDGTLKNNFGGTITEDEINVTQNMPDIVRLGVRVRPVDSLEVRLFGDYTRWSLLDDQCLAVEDAAGCEVDPDTGAPVTTDPAPLQNLRRDWNDAVGVRAGLSVWPSERAEIFTGVGYDSNAVPDETLEPALTDFHDISAALGVKLTPVKQLALALSYTHFFYISRDNTGLSRTSSYQTPSRGPDSGGQYTQAVGVVNANVELSLF